MKKNGFSLAELMITLAIVAIVSAVLMPSLGKLMPDNNKMKILNAHSQISNSVDRILSDDSMYNCANEDDDELEALACDGSVPGGTTASGDGKFEELMVEELGIKTSSGDSVLPWKASNGSFWGFEKFGTKNDAYYIITIDLNGSKKPNEIFSAAQQSPDRFRFKVNNFGGIVPYDALTEAYLRNSLNSNAKGEDKNQAKKLLNTKTYK